MLTIHESCQSCSATKPTWKIPNWLFLAAANLICQYLACWQSQNRKKKHGPWKIWASNIANVRGDSSLTAKEATQKKPLSLLSRKILGVQMWHLEYKILFENRCNKNMIRWQILHVHSCLFMRRSGLEWNVIYLYKKLNWRHKFPHPRLKGHENALWSDEVNYTWWQIRYVC